MRRFSLVAVLAVFAVLVGAAAGKGYLSADMVSALQPQALITQAAAFTGQWWFAPALAVTMAAFLAIGLPGSLFIWIAGLLLPPLVAAPTVLVGGVVGAGLAYQIARRAGLRWVAPHRRQRWGQLMRQRGDFATLVALRVAPGVPHAVISFGSGLVEIPWRRYLAASTLGLVIKSGLYVTAIHRATHVSSLQEALSWSTTTPLLLLAAALVVASLVRNGRAIEAFPTPAAEPEV